MKLSKIHFTALSSVLASIMLVACGGSQAEPETAATPPPPPPAQTAAPVAQSTAAATETPAPAPAAEPAAAPEKPKTPPQLRMLFAAIGELKLTDQQKPTVESIEADMTKAAEPPMDLRGQLTADLADGVAAGKIDKAKTGKDVKALVARADESTAKTQEAANKLHAALDPAQRKQLADSMSAKHEEMKKKMEEMMGGKGPEGAGPPGKGEMKPGAAEGHMGPPGQDDDDDMHHGMMMGHMHRHLDMIADGIGLSAEQKDKLGKKLEAEKKGEEGKMKARMKEMDAKMKAIGEAFQKDKFDAKKAGIAAEHPQMVKEMAEGRVKFAEMVLSVLTPDQRAKAAEHLREHATKKGEQVPAAAAAPEKSEKGEKADKGEKKAEKAEMKADKAESKADKAEMKADKAESKAEKAEMKADKAEKKADKAEKGEKK